MSNKRTPIPSDPVEGFAHMVSILASQMGVMENMEIAQHTKLLLLACDRHVFEQGDESKPKRHREQDKRTFITIFKSRYLQHLDLEYEVPFTGVDTKMITGICVKLRKKGLTPDEYLAWFFNDFLEDNPKFSPPSPKLICGGMVWQRFLHAFQGEIRKRERVELMKKEAKALNQRSRALMRLASEHGQEDFKEKVKKVVQVFREKGIMGDLRKDIEGLEAESATWAK